MREIALVILIGYLLGNFATSYFLGKLIKNTDIRQHGSGNAGATNALRVFGVKIAAITFLIDALKGCIAVLIGRMILGEVGGLISGISVVVGHNWPILLKFKGGKGIASTIGVVLTINYLVALVCFLFGIIIVIKSRYVSLGSILAMGILPIVGLIIVKPFNIQFLIFTIVMSFMAIFRHRSNINRLIKGEESKIGKKAH